MNKEIINQLSELLDKDSRTHAMWIAGSVAEGYADEFSDIDLWVDIDDGEHKAIYDLIEEFLNTKGQLDINHDARMRLPFSHKVYHFKGTNPYHFIEFTLQDHSRNYVFTEGLNKIDVLFDKDNTIKTKSLDKQSIAEENEDRKQFLLEKIEIGSVSVNKEIKRGNFMDAMHNYQFWLVEPIIELARIKYSPLKASYGLKHGDRDLPQDISAEIKSLFLISSLEDLHLKVKKIKTSSEMYT